MVTQSYDNPAASNTLAASRPKWNDSVDAVRAFHEGPTAPSTTTAYMWWCDTTSGIMKMRNAADTAWIDFFDHQSTHGNLVHLNTSGQTFSGSLNLGGNSLDNITENGASSAARVDSVTAKADLAAPSFTGDATINQDPAGGTSIVRRSWTESTFVELAGDTMTGRLGVPSSPAAGSGEALRKDEIEGLTTFDTTSGHDHDGSNSKAADASASPPPASAIVAVSSNGRNRRTETRWVPIEMNSV